MWRSLCLVGVLVFNFNAAAMTIALNSPQGQQRLSESQYRRAFIPLLINYTTQATQSFCSLASTVMILNALKVPAPFDSHYYPYKRFNQENILSPAVLAIKRRNKIIANGLTLEEIKRLVEIYDIPTQSHHGSDLSLDTFRTLIKKTLRAPNQYIIVNYNRKTAGQDGGGHFSPIAAYHSASDSVLILDVARYRYLPFWINLNRLFAAIQTIDSHSTQSRGVLVLAKSKDFDNEVL